MPTPASLPGLSRIVLLGALGLAGIAAHVPGPPQKNISSVFVRAEHLTLLTGKFSANFRAAQGGTFYAVGTPEHSVSWSALSGIVPTALPDSISDFGLRFYYGLDDQNNFRPAVEVVGLVKVDATVMPYVDDAEGARMYRVATVNSQLYALEDGALTAVNAATWMSTVHQRYKERMCLKRTDKSTTWVPIEPGLDPVSEIFPWNMEVKRLGTENQVTGTSTVKIACMADPSGWLDEGGTKWGSDFQHTLCLYINGAIGNSTADEFKGHGANLGTLCPSRCGYYVRPAELQP